MLAYCEIGARARGYLGLVAKSAIIDAKVADAAFALKTGEISQPIQGTFGTVLVKVGKIEPGSQASYESVAANLKKEIALERAPDERSANSNCTSRARTSLPLTV